MVNNIGAMRPVSVFKDCLPPDRFQSRPNDAERLSPEIAKRSIKGFGDGRNLVFALVKDLITRTDRDRRAFCFDALDLELRRVDANITCDDPIIEASRDYKNSIGDARFAQVKARTFRFLSHEFCELPYHWMNLVSYRIGVERGLRNVGFSALAIAACERLGIPRWEVDRWSESLFFERLANTELRQEWVYPGIQFRLPGTR